jgi:hypothetical protein
MAEHSPRVLRKLRPDFYTEELKNNSPAPFDRLRELILWRSGLPVESAERAPPYKTLDQENPAERSSRVLRKLCPKKL